MNLNGSAVASFVMPIILLMIGGWIYLEKSHEKGWKILIPGYNVAMVAKQAGILHWGYIGLIMPFIWLFVIKPAEVAESVGSKAGTWCYILAVISILYAFKLIVQLIIAICKSMPGIFSDHWFICLILFLIAPGPMFIIVSVFGTYWTDAVCRQ